MTSYSCKDRSVLANLARGSQAAPVHLSRVIEWWWLYCTYIDMVKHLPSVRLRCDGPASARAQHQSHARRGPVGVAHLRSRRSLATPAAPRSAPLPPQVGCTVLCERNKHAYIVHYTAVQVPIMGCAIRSEYKRKIKLTSQCWSRSLSL